jgi:hypothetical protein
MGLVYDEDNSLLERVKRAIFKSPKRTSLIVLVVLLAVLSPQILSWFDSASEGIGSVTAEHDLTANMTLGPGDLEDEEIAPWLVSQSETMANATTPPQWETSNYRFGPCASDRLAEIADAGYGQSVTEACGLLYDIQGKYSRDCFIAANCVVKDEAKSELAAVADLLRSAHSGAGYVWPNP